MARADTLRAMRWIAFLVALVAAGTARADEPHAEFRLGDRDTPHVGVPFVVGLVIVGFEENPQPTPPKLDVPNATVKFLGARPNVSQSVQIFNGKRTDSVQVTWVLTWQVEARKEGALHVPSVSVSQGARRATPRPRARASSRHSTRRPRPSNTSRRR